ncbi:MAG: hypothetical protein QNJ46_35150 [Leptolyngbyaceae cyanobacterium MO_188.B28]|nr:hypothetical protein [Leptolyngbyaceae cyanobacterium MO_188.B28]
MYWPLVGIAPTIQRFLAAYREVFCRDAGFEHVSRYINGLLLSANKTLQGIYAQIVWPEGKQVSRRAMHEAVFESGWSRNDLMKRHRQNVAPNYRGRGRAVLSLDWTFGYHPYSQKIYGAKEAYDYVNRCWSCYQTVVTAAVANPHRVDGLAVEVQQPNYQKEELRYLTMTQRDSYEQMEQVRERLLELLHYHQHRLSYRKRTEIAVEIVRQIEAEGCFPQADYAFDQGVLTCPLTTLIESAGKHWVSEIESTRLILWKDQWTQVQKVAKQLKQTHPESFRHKRVRCRNGEIREIWAFSKVVRLKKYGRKRLVIVHETADLSDAPRFLLTDALHWDSSRVFATWSFRWPIETFHEFAKQLVGFEAAQLRNEEAVKRHFCLSCLAQSALQQASCQGQKSERFDFADNHEQPIGQRLYSLSREAVEQVVVFAQSLLLQGQSVEQIMEVLMPA